MLLRNLSSREDPDIFQTMSSPAPAPARYHDGDNEGGDSNNQGENNALDDVWGDADDGANYDHDRSHDHDSHPTSTSSQDQESHHNHHHPSSFFSQSHPSDVPRLQAEHTTAGYRDGITDAKSSSVQAGFDEGFGLGATIGAHVGQLLGVLEGLAFAELVQGQTTPPPETLLVSAQLELSVQSVFGKDYWAEDGTWTYDEEGGEEVLFAHVGAAHPLVKKWDGIIRAEAARYGLVWDVLAQEAEEERREEEEGEAAAAAAAADAMKETKDAKPAVASQSREALAW
ncbi:hypothetical protein B0T17DRAFT_493297 [Bombardia bombarda]|uniref:Protein YAE1 n=1 Tax=Bombardia bombarda TaxID=252184 RepID=A0AA39WZS2_9PEZI|nr:hypothetical protein B0T17DRAFT_493297 [Bombardia bombarda]